MFTFTEICAPIIVVVAVLWAFFDGEESRKPRKVNHRE